MPVVAKGAAAVRRAGAAVRPARVDPETGYRYYAAGQLERARLVAWLRRLGMPLARIRDVCALTPSAAAEEIRAYWAQVETETAARRDLAAFLVDQLTAAPRKDTTMLELRYFAQSDRGRVRPANQDTAYAGTRLLAVADGFGPAGAPASGAAVEALRFLDTADVPAGEVLNLLEDAVRGATEAVRDIATTAEAGPEDIGTTLTALLWTGSRLALVHIGDSRAYLLRDGAFYIHDHGWSMMIERPSPRRPPPPATRPAPEGFDGRHVPGSGPPSARRPPR
ncbi:MerR family transcriptional regulator OS=Streptomyces alboniger OX=132473 GN=CP975_16230 PE=4 SV=1 [Streptomyces alboniger]